MSSVLKARWWCCSYDDCTAWTRVCFMCNLKQSREQVVLYNLLNVFLYCYHLKSLKCFDASLFCISLFFISDLQDGGVCNREPWFVWYLAFWKQLFTKFRFRFSKVPKLYGRISGDMILFVSWKIRRLKAQNFADTFIFIPFTTWKARLHRISGSEFYEWLFEPEKFSRLSRTGPWQLAGLLHLSLRAKLRFVSSCMQARHVKIRHLAYMKAT